jgi:hypothetical protein
MHFTSLREQRPKGAVLQALSDRCSLTSTGSGANTSAAVDFNTTLPIGGANYNPTARIMAVDSGNSSRSIYFLSNIGGALRTGDTQINQDGDVDCLYPME